VVDTAPEFERSLEDLASPEAGQEPRDRLVQALQPHRSHFVDERVGLTEIVVLGVQDVGSGAPSHCRRLCVTKGLKPPGSLRRGVGVGATEDRPPRNTDTEGDCTRVT
jgi:hypothetical protein